MAPTILPRCWRRSRTRWRARRTDARRRGREGDRSMGTGLLIARASRGLAISVHAVQDLLGRLDGEGLKGTGGGLGFWPGVLFVLAAGLGEAGSGLLTAAGFLGAVGPALIIL